MKKPIIIIILSIFAFIGGFLIFYQSRPAAQKTPATPETNQQTNNPQKWETKTDDQASVTITVTPTQLSEESEEWKFDVIMDTHSVELGEDLTKISMLIDDQGKEYKALTWEGPTGGHHREGILVFSRVTPTPKSVELRISDIGGVLRSFKWQLK